MTPEKLSLILQFREGVNEGTIHRGEVTESDSLKNAGEFTFIARHKTEGYHRVYEFC